MSEVEREVSFIVNTSVQDGISSAYDASIAVIRRAIRVEQKRDMPRMALIRGLTAALRRKERAGWRCECAGECGRGTHEGRCPNQHRQAAYGTGSLVILTTAHLDHTPEHCDDDNLKAMCNGCHLHYDREHHAESAYAARRAGRAIGDLFGPAL